jgi:hypothetical protein
MDVEHIPESWPSCRLGSIKNQHAKIIRFIRDKLDLCSFALQLHNIHTQAG